MIRGTTPKHIFVLPFSTDLVAAVRVIYSQNGDVVLVKEGDSVTLTGDSVETKLTQDDTLTFHCDSTVEIQVRILTLGGEALASDVIRMRVERCLENEVLA